MSGRATISGGRQGEGVGAPANLIELLRALALGRPARTSHRFLSDDGEREISFTYGELDRRARAVGAWLQESGASGGRVLLLLPPGLEYVAAFFGCLYAGAVAVPAYPPRANRSLERLHSIAVEAEASAALTSRQILSKLTPALALAPALGSLRWAASEEIEDGRAELWREPEVTRETLAFLQFTSGSTANPKGVMVSHGNLLHNEEMIRRAFGQDERSVIVGWLPLYHDMGLIGNVLQPLYVGAECVLMSPVSFLQKPLRWLQAVSRFRATTSGGPNFAYDLCVRKTTPEERAALDLSSWRVAFNGAEPVRAETLRRFAEAFAPSGFRASAFQPCYGLAEATLLVTAAARDEGPALVRVAADALEQNRVVEAEADGEGVRALVGCGGSSQGQSLLVVNPETLVPCGPSEVGEIWVAGPSVAGGYWRRPEETAHTFGAYLRETGEGPFLRTGDLGFLRAGELFVTGRLKDLLIVRGRNLYPQDIERTAEESHAALRPGCGAAFAVEVAGEERVVVVQEVERGAGGRLPADALANVRQALGEEHDLQAHAVLLVKANSVPKTSSGKVRRRACREMFLRSEFEPLAEWREAATPPPGDAAAAAAGESPAPPSSLSNVEDVTNWLRARLAARLGLDAADIETACPVTRYGLDSLSAVEMSHSVETELGASLPHTSFLEGRSIADLAEEVARQTSGDEARAGRATDEAAADDSGLLSHGQKALWLLHRMAPESGAYNVARAVRVRGELDAESLRRAFQALAQRHAALRTTFEFDGGEPASRVHEDLPVDFASEDATRLSEAEVGARLGEEARRPFDLAAGPLLRVRLLKRAAGEHALLVVVHHIVSDFWSLAVMLGELGELYRAAREGAPPRLAPPEVGYADYVRWQTRLLEGPEGERLWSYWRGRLANLPPLDMPTDRPRPPAQTYVGASHAFRLGAELTARLRALGRERGATLYTTLLAAFNVLLSRYTGQRDLAVGTPTAGRARPAFSDVVGYFVNPVVVRSDLSGDPRFEDFLERTRRAALDAFAHQDYPFALLVRQLQPERDASRSPLFQAMFVLQQTQRLREEGVSALALGEAGARLRVGGLELESMTLDQRVAQFDLSLSVAETGDTLLASLEYNTDLFDPHTVQRLATHFRTLLEGITANPRRRLSRLPLLGEDERRQILRGWNDTAAPLPPHATLHGLFERQAERTPHAV
ncbi:MAG TPA: condensation domain-containing protein, partial [Pyrinomonadaceae bacterium]|nr:condensation domain-containing protein [Pyrinomonadaceae bacterium]